VEYKIGDEVISPEGQILTLTHLEAEKLYPINGQLQPLLSEKTVTDRNEFLEIIAAPDADVGEIEPTQLEQVARFIAAMAPILLTIGMLALWVEFQTPGLGWAGMAGALCLGLFFFGHHIAGLSGYEDILLFSIGVALILVELFVLPGFGIAGLFGVLIMLASLLNAMTPSMPDGSWMPDVSQMGGAARNLGLSLVMSLGGMLLVGRYMPRSKAFQWLVLNESTSRDTGYAASEDRLELEGKTGKAITALRPGGAAWIEDNRYDVVSRGRFIDAGHAIRVAEVHGNRIVVEPVEDAS
jgi:membrane-bound serine protease (ClpP class)